MDGGVHVYLCLKTTQTMGKINGDSIIKKGKKVRLDQRILNDFQQLEFLSDDSNKKLRPHI